MVDKTMTNVSCWKKGDKYFRLETKKDWAVSERRCEARFIGDNPFPCHSMTTSYAVLASWLIKNGWERVGNISHVTVTDTIDDETGEVLNHSVVKTAHIYHSVGRVTLDE